MRRRLLNRPQRCDPPPPQSPAQEECNVGDISGVAPLESSSSESSSWGDSFGQNEDCETPEAAVDDCDITNVTPLSSECSSSESSSCDDSFGLNEEGEYVPPAQLDESRHSTYWEDLNEQGGVEIDDDDLEYTISEEEEAEFEEDPEPERTFGDELFQMAGYSDVWDAAEMFPECDGPEDEDIVRESVFRRDEQMAHVPLEPCRAIWSYDAINPDETGYSSIHECEIGDDPEGRVDLMRRRRWAQYQRGLEAGDDVGPLIHQFRAGLSPRHRSPGNLAIRRMIQHSPGWAGYPDPNASQWSYDGSGAGDCSEIYFEDDDDDLSDFSPMFTSTPPPNEHLHWTC